MALTAPTNPAVNPTRCAVGAFGVWGWEGWACRFPFQLVLVELSADFADFFREIRVIRVQRVAKNKNAHFIL